MDIGVVRCKSSSFISLKDLGFKVTAKNVLEGFVMLFFRISAVLSRLKLMLMLSACFST